MRSSEIVFVVVSSSSSGSSSSWNSSWSCPSCRDFSNLGAMFEDRPSAGPSFRIFVLVFIQTRLTRVDGTDNKDK